MLVGLEEREGNQQVKDLALHVFEPDQANLAAMFDHIDYLFMGTAADAGGLIFAGGVTNAGQSVTGSGPSKAAALASIAGEAAESMVAANHTPAPQSKYETGFGAGVCDADAAQHAQHELAERFAVRAWWRGIGPSHIMDQATHDKLVPALSDRTTRQVRLIHLGASAFGPVIIAASFTDDGFGFCFGAACRNDVQTAATAAMNELVQSEVGLSISQMKQTRFDAEKLSDADQLNLSLATLVSRARLEESLCGADQTPQDQIGPGKAQVQVEPLGNINGISVARATAPGFELAAGRPIVDLAEPY